MAAKNSKDVIVFDKDSWEGGKGGKHAPSGQYRAKLSPKSKIKPGQSGNIANLGWVITGDKKGKKTKASNLIVYDNIAPHVVWKIAQVLRAIGIKKMPKKMTLPELLAILKKYGKEIRIVVGTHKWQGKTQNNIDLYLPLAVSKDEEDDDTDEDDEDEGGDDTDDDEDDESDDEDSDDDEGDSDEDDEDSDDEDDEDAEEEDEDEDEDEDDEDDEDEEEDDDEDEDEDEDEEEDDEDDEDEDEDDEEEEDTPPRRAKPKTRAKKPAPKKRAAKKAPVRRGAKKGKRK